MGHLAEDSVVEEVGASTDQNVSVARAEEEVNARPTYA